MSLTLPPLPYALDALEPYISRRTLAAHHGNHHGGYVEKTRVLTRRTPLESAPLEDIVLASASQDKALFNAAAQAWNHQFYWNSLRPGGGGEAYGAIAQRLEECFGSQQAFRQQFVTVAGDHFGSGWVWLVLDAGQLRLMPTSNAETPWVTTALPVLTLDVWEHAYYLDYQHRRLDYIAAFLAHLVNWDFVNRTLADAERREAPSATGGGSAGGLAARRSTPTSPCHVNAKVSITASRIILPEKRHPRTSARHHDDHAAHTAL